MHLKQDLVAAKNPGDPLDRMLDNWIKKTRSFRYVFFPIYICKAIGQSWFKIVKREHGDFTTPSGQKGRDCHFEAAKKTVI